MTNLVHISDIHFSQPRTAAHFDEYSSIRSACLADVRSLVSQYGPAQTILVTGDISARGTEKEFNLVEAWFIDLCSAAGCEQYNVCIVPGNHDVDRSVIEKSVLIKTVHDVLRNENNEKARDQRFTEFLSDQEMAKGLVSPLHDYNEFATQYDSTTTVASLNWTRQQPLDYGYTLKITGFNSVLLSDGNDDDEKNRLMLGSIQSLGEITRGVIEISMCHHPPDWLFDHDNLHDRFKHRFQMQLFGHKHTPRVDRLVETCIIRAGALQPKDEAGYLPQYSFLRLGIDRSDADYIDMEIYRREWNAEEQDFVGMPPPHAHRIPVPDRRTLFGKEHQVDAASESESPKVVSAEKPEALVRPSEDDARALVYDFQSLGKIEQRRILEELELIDEEDKTRYDGATVVRYFAKAREDRKTGRLWQLVQQALGRADAANPFEGF